MIIIIIIKWTLIPRQTFSASVDYILFSGLPQWTLKINLTGSCYFTHFINVAMEALRLEWSKTIWYVYIRIEALNHLVTQPCFCLWDLLSKVDEEAEAQGQWDGESRAPKNWCFWTVVLEKTLESPLDSKEIQPVHPKGDQSWVFIERTDAEAKTPILWPPDVKSWLIGKDPDSGKDWGQEEKGMTEDEMVGWHHRLKGHEFG